jgi:aryl-alcohol dehydrogenase-like predicted oxidoreductase
MQYTRLGKSDITVSRIAMGCWAIAGGLVWGEQDDKDAIETIGAALDEGITFFDTAEAYGDGYSEQLLGKALKGKRRDVIIASKVRPGNVAYDKTIQACEQSLKNLQTDYIDLYQIHWPVPDVPFEETYSALSTLKQQGKIRTIGVSNFGVKNLEDFLQQGHCLINQVSYSLLFRAIEYEILPYCREHEIGVLPYSPLAQGLLTGKFKSVEDVPEERRRTRFYSSENPLARHGDEGCEEEVFSALERIDDICRELEQPMTHVALAWLLHKPGITSVIAGARRPDQIRDNAGAIDLKLTDDIIERLDNATGDLKEELGNNADLWEAESRVV